jgi:hypothetical protein
MDCKNVEETSSKVLPSRPCAAIPIFVPNKGMPVPIAIGKVRQDRSLAQYTFIFLLLVVVFPAFSQRQLIVLKNEEVLARYQKGDVIHFAREQDKEILVQRILDLNDTLLMMNFDSVAYYRIKRLDIRARKKMAFHQKLGRYMIVAGVLLPVIEVLNTGVFQDEDREPTVSSQVWIASGVLVAGGAILAFTQKSYFKPGRKYRLIIVDKRSPFYKEKPQPEGFNSPYIPKN